MSPIKDGGPAFPCGESFTLRDAWGNETQHSKGPLKPGMSLRDYFAAHAPPMPEQWFKDSPRKKGDPLWHWGEASAAWAYFYADAMIEVRDREPVEPEPEQEQLRGSEKLDLDGIAAEALEAKRD